MAHLKPGGRVLISVPAHARKYGRSDLLVGHVRRYEKSGLLALLTDAGTGDVHIVNYGYLLTELTRRISNRLIRDDHSYDNLTPEEPQYPQRPGKAQSRQPRACIGQRQSGVAVPRDPAMVLRP